MPPTPRSAQKPKWVGRSAASRILGCSLTTVHRYHGRGLSPKKDKNDAYLYEVEEVERLAAVFRVKGVDSGRKPKNLGELAKKVFQAFEIGMTIPEIVIKWGVAPERVQEWLDVYNGIEKAPLTEKERIELEIRQAELRLKQERQQLISEKHLTVQRNRRDPITHRLRDDWGE